MEGHPNIVPLEMLRLDQNDYGLQPLLIQKLPKY